jgi:copper chaperone CopZ
MQNDSSSTGTLTLAISGMSCGHCVAAVTDALRNVPGAHVEQVAIGSATLALDPGSDAAAVASEAIDAVDDAGYSATVAEPGSMPAPGTVPLSRTRRDGSR